VAKKKQRVPKISRQQAQLNKVSELMTEPWRLAISKLREQISEECLSHSSEQRRFQNGRLIRNFVAELRPPLWESAELSYWLFCGSPLQDQFGYEDACQQHYAELKALGFSREFHPSKDQLKHNFESVLQEYTFRFDSLASWIEAHESWIVWRMLNSQPAMWDRGDPNARRQEIVATIIAQLPIPTDGPPAWAITAIIESSQKWKGSRWLKVLKAAVRIAGQPEKVPTELEEWVWWRYPIFSRYSWSASEICRAARKKFGERHDVTNEAAFQSAWVRRGLRFTGRKTRRRRPPQVGVIQGDFSPIQIILKRLL
jgi:hypothetical protein